MSTTPRRSVPPMKKLVRKVRRRFLGPPPRPLDYQDKLADSLKERCDLIDRAIPEGSRTVFDIGCNLGDITAHYARRGFETLGIDNDARLIREARRRHAGVQGCRFEHMDLGPADIPVLPVRDVVLLLSVHHHWLMAHGPEVAGTMLQDLAERTDKVLIFEGAATNIRYGDYPPGFIDNDEASVTGYLSDYLDRYVADRFDRIEPLGKTRCVGEREPYRWSWALYR